MISITPRRTKTIEYLDPRTNFLSLQTQILNSEKYPEIFEHAVWASEVALSLIGPGNIPLFAEMCPKTQTQGNPKQTYVCHSGCPYIHHYPLLAAIQKMAEKILKNTNPEKGRESPTLTESVPSSRSSSPLPDELKE